MSYNLDRVWPIIWYFFDIFYIVWPNRYLDKNDGGHYIKANKCSSKHKPKYQHRYPHNMVTILKQNINIFKWIFKYSSLSYPLDNLFPAFWYFTTTIESLYGFIFSDHQWIIRIFTKIWYIPYFQGPQLITLFVCTSHISIILHSFFISISWPVIRMNMHQKDQ